MELCNVVSTHLSFFINVFARPFVHLLLLSDKSFLEKKKKKQVGSCLLLPRAIMLLLYSVHNSPFLLPPPVRYLRIFGILQLNEKFREDRERLLYVLGNSLGRVSSGMHMLTILLTFLFLLFFLL
jgi:hypothetical protein